ncbi:MAG: UPF0716 protein FxsA [Candidatus Tokpelaia sp. JSC188]|nr:MAG: UPF0716 protein FxsA [Candidatus Tokpelaia sp. JSC188]
MQSAFSASALIVLLVIFTEIAGFIIIGSKIGILATLIFVLISIFVGIYLLRGQGINILLRMQNKFIAGHVPDREIAEAVMIVISAIFFIIPGFVSDIIGIILFIRPVRNLIWRYFSNYFSCTCSHRRWEAKIIDLNQDDYYSDD